MSSVPEGGSAIRGSSSTVFFAVLQAGRPVAVQQGRSIGGIVSTCLNHINGIMFLSKARSLKLTIVQGGPPRLVIPSTVPGQRIYREGRPHASSSFLALNLKP